MAQFVFILYVFLTSLTAVFAVAFVVYAFRARQAVGVTVFGLWMVATSGWVLMHMALFMVQNILAALTLLRVEWIFQVLVPPTFTLFALQYQGFRRWVIGWRQLLLFIFPFLLITLSWNNQALTLIWNGLSINLENNILPLQYTPGSAYWIYWLYSYGCLLIALWAFTRQRRTQGKAYLRQSRLLSAGVLIPLIMNIFSIFQPQSPFGFNAPSFSFTLGGVLVAFAIYRYRLFDLSPSYYHSLLESLQDGVIVLDQENRLLQANQLAASLLGLERTQSLGEKLEYLLDQNSPWLALLNTTPDQKNEIQIGVGDDSNFYSLSCSLIEEPNHEHDRVITIGDVTQESLAKISEAKSREMAEIRAGQLDVLQKVSARLNQAVKLTDVTDSGLEQIVLGVGARFGYVISADIHGRPKISGTYRLPPLLQERFERSPFCPPCISFKRFMAGEYQEPVAFIPCEILKEISISYSGLISIPLHLGARQLGVLNLVMAPNVIFTGDEIGLLQTVGDSYSAALERAHLYENAEHLATMDSLTSLFNRRHFFQLAQSEFDRANRYQHALSILMIDIDYFKQVNDKFGHLIGDQVLQQISNRFRSHLRSSDFIGRYGGEEFVVLMPETDLENGRIIADRIRASITDRPFVTDKGEISLTISVGVASKQLDMEGTLEMVLDHADQALMQAKSLGRNKVSIWQVPNTLDGLLDG